MQFLVPLLGSLSERHAFEYLDERGKVSSAMHPAVAEEVLQQPDFDHLRPLAEQTLQYPEAHYQRLVHAKKIHLLIYTAGGANGAQLNALQITADAVQNGSEVHLYAGSYAQSAGANVWTTPYATSKHALANTELLWHMPRMRDGTEVADVLRAQHDTRMHIRRLLLMLRNMPEDARSPLWSKVRDASIFASAGAAEVEWNLVTQGEAGTTNAPTPQFRPEGDITLQGEHFRACARVAIHGDFQAFAQAFERQSGVAAKRKTTHPFARILNFMRVIWLARRSGTDAEIQHDADGDLVATASDAAIMEKYQTEWL